MMEVVRVSLLVPEQRSEALMPVERNRIPLLAINQPELPLSLSLFPCAPEGGDLKRA